MSSFRRNLTLEMSLILLSELDVSHALARDFQSRDYSVKLWTHRCLKNLSLRMIAGQKSFRDNRRTLLFRAISQGHKDIVSLLMESSAKPYGYKEDAPLLEAISKVHKDIVEVLLDKGIKLEHLDDYTVALSTVFNMDP